MHEQTISAPACAVEATGGRAACSTYNSARPPPASPAPRVPHRMIADAQSATAYSIVAASPLGEPGAYGGTMFPRSAERSSSPGRVWQMRSGTMRVGAGDEQRLGVCPSANRRKKSSLGANTSAWNL